MANGYIRQDTEDTIAEDQTADPNVIDLEFNTIEAAFNSVGGHRHDGTIGGGARILTLGPSGEISIAATGELVTTGSGGFGSSTRRWSSIYGVLGNFEDISAADVEADSGRYQSLTTGALAVLNGVTVAGTTNLQRTDIQQRLTTRAADIGGDLSVTGVTTAARVNASRIFTDELTANTGASRVIAKVGSFTTSVSSALGDFTTIDSNTGVIRNLTGEVFRTGALGINRAPNDHLLEVGSGSNDETTAYFYGVNTSNILMRTATDGTSRIWMGDSPSYLTRIESRNAEDHLLFYTRGEVALKLDDNQKLSVNTQSITAQLNVYADDNTTDLVRLLSNSGVGTENLRFRIDTRGNVQNSNNSYGSLSDRRLKESIVDVSDQWDDIKSLHLVNFNFTGDDERMIGLIAQEVREISPGLVFESDGNLGVKYSIVMLKALKVIQQLQARVEALEAGQ